MNSSLFASRPFSPILFQALAGMAWISPAGLSAKCRRPPGETLRALAQARAFLIVANFQTSFSIKAKAMKRIVARCRHAVFVALGASLTCFQVPAQTPAPAEAVPETIEPADPQLIPEARDVLQSLRSVYGKKVVAAINGADGAQAVLAASGKEPVIVAFDLSGWNSPPWGESYNKTAQGAIDKAKAWHESGGIVSMQLHWIHPANPNGTAWRGAHGRKPASPPFEFEAALTPGTPQNEQLMRDLKGHADLLQQLAAAGIPVLWRPLHEIDGGWFWWTDMERPENTAALWRTMFDYFVNERGLHNLIWVYSASLRCGKGEEGISNIDLRKRFYPGDAYLDIAGIDVYPSEYIKIGKPQADSYPRHFQTMQALAPLKMIALCECEAVPNPDLMASEGPIWLYCLPWWGGGKRNPEDWIKATYAHDLLLTKERFFAQSSR